MLLVRGIRLPLTVCAPEQEATARALHCLLYTSDAADE